LASRIVGDHAKKALAAANAFVDSVSDIGFNYVGAKSTIEKN
jgi:hypothetical protein